MRFALHPLLLLVLAGCVSTPTPHVEMTAKGDVARADGNTIAVVDVSRARRDQEVGECVRSAMAAANPELRTMPGRQFRDATYPWFEPEIAPSNADQLTALLSRPAVRERFAALEVRFVVAVDSRTTSTDDGFFVCGAGYGGGGCLGIGTEALTSASSAAVWDIERPSSLARLTSTAEGENVSVGAIVPLFFISKTEESACEGLGRELARLLGTAVER